MKNKTYVVIEIDHPDGNNPQNYEINTFLYFSENEALEKKKNLNNKYPHYWGGPYNSVEIHIHES